MRNAPSIIEVTKKYGSAETCVKYLEAMRWPDGVRCPICGGKEISKFVTNETTRERKNRKGQVREVTVPARHLYTCLEPTCNYQFSPTVGTIFHDTHLPLEKWFQAVALMCNAKKGLSAKQMERDLGVTYRTAWYLNHRIRKAMDEGIEGLFTGKVEVDETYLGGRYDKRRKREPWEKQGIAGAIQRRTPKLPSQVRVEKINTPSKAVLTGFVRKNVSTEATLLYTDESAAYKSLKADYRHDVVRHKALEFVRGDVHTQSIENFWSLFKRGLIGSFHKISVKHLDRYLAEFCFRFNNREAEDLFGLVMLNLVVSTGIKYAELIGKQEEEPF
jgi:hypothetical protein